MNADQDADERWQLPSGRRIILIAVGIAVVAWVVTVGLLTAAAIGHLRTGQAAIASASEAIKSTDVTSSDAPDLLDPVTSSFAAAAADLRNPAFAPLRAIPVVGRQLRAARDQGSGAAAATEVTDQFILELHNDLQLPHVKPHDRVVQAQAVAATAATAKGALANISFGTDRALIPYLRHRHNDLTARLAVLRSGIQRLQVAANTVATLLAGPRHFLVLGANNAEMRSGSGIFQSALTVDFNDGTITVGSVRDTAGLALPPGAVALGGDMANLWGALTPNQEWRNLGLSPQFDQTAALAASMWKADTGENVDGVMVLDVAALRAILQATGPLEVGPALVSSDSVLPLVLHDQYIGAAQQERVGLVAASALNALQGGQFDPAALGAGLPAMVTGRHILIWSAHADEETAWRAAGVAGVMAPDSVLVGIINRGVNKLDPFLNVNTQLTIRAGSQATDVTATVRLTNTAPAGEQPSVAGTGIGGIPPGSYFGYVAVTVPGVATRVQVDGSASANVFGPDGPDRVVAVLRRIDQGQTVSVVVTFQLPERHGDLQLESSARIPASQFTIVHATPETSVSDEARPRIVW